MYIQNLIKKTKGAFFYLFEGGGFENEYKKWMYTLPMQK